MTDTTGQARGVSTGNARRWRGLAICAVLLIVAGGLVGVLAWMPQQETPKPPRKVVPINVEVCPVEAVAELADTLDVTAVVEPERVVNVAAEVSGRIERLGRRSADLTWRGRVIAEGMTIDEGEPVTEGEPIVYLNRELLQARFDRSEAQFEYDEREYRRIAGLNERGTTSKTELDDARTRRDISRATLDEATRELERATIVAPTSGILNRLPMEVGEYASPGEVVAEIVVIDRVKVVVDVPERDILYLKVGQPAEVFSRVTGGDRYTGEITYISELAASSSRTTRLEISVDNSRHTLRSGQIVRARLTRRVLKDALMIPLASVIPLEDGRVVYVVDGDDKAERRDVELGMMKGRRVQVVRGLEVGDRLIVAGHRYVGPGQPVVVVSRDVEQQ